MKCQIDTYLLQDYLDNELDKLENIILEEHLKVCSRCRKELSEYKLLNYEIDNMNLDIDLPEELDDIKDYLISEFVDEDKESLSSKKFYKKQKEVLKNSIKFIDYMPMKDVGSKILKNTSKVTIKKAKSLSIKGLKYGFNKFKKRKIV